MQTQYHWNELIHIRIESYQSQINVWRDNDLLPPGGNKPYPIGHCEMWQWF